MDRRHLLMGLGGSALLAGLPVATGQSAQGNWLKLESPNFTFFTPGEETKSREELAVLEGFHALLFRLMPRTSPSPLKLTVYNTRSRRDFEATWPGVGGSVLGFYSARIEQIRAVAHSDRDMDRQRGVPRHARALDSRAVLLHEYAHHHMRANNRLAYPAWYTEGFAEFLSTAEFGDKGVNVGKVTLERGAWIVDGDWMPIEPFLTKHPGEFSSGEEVAQFYAQAWLATHYLFATPERARGFDAYTRALLQGGDLLSAFEPSFGITPAQFDKELWAYRRRPIQFWTLPDSKPVSENITSHRLNRSADDLLLPTSHLLALPSREAAKDSVARVREQARKHPGDPYALQCQALAEVWYGDLAEARKQIDALLPLDEANPDVHHLSGLCDLRAGRKAKDHDLLLRAQESFGRAHQISDTRPQTMYRYVESGLPIEGMTPHLLDVLVRAYKLAPQVDAIAMTTAQALISQERYDEAILVLQPLTAELHGGDMPGIARRLTEVAKNRERTSFSFFGAAAIEGE